MADQKVSDLPSLNGADVDPADLLYIIDSSAGSAGSKKITVGQYQLAPVSGGAANGVMYLDGSKVVTTGSGLVFDGTNFSTTGTATATKLIPTGGAATGNGMYLPAANTLAWSTNGAETMRLDSSGNLGLGVTPSAWWSGRKSFQFGGTGNSSFVASAPGTANYAELGSNYFTSSTPQDVYYATGTATRYVQETGAHKWFTAPSGTAGNAISFTQAMTLDASGNLAVGTSTTTNARLFSFVNDASLPGLGVRQDGAGPIQIWQSGGAIERARITSGGDLLVGTATVSGAGGITYLNQGSTGFASINNNNAAATGYVFQSFRRSSTEIGSVTQNGTTAVLFNITSDRRLKDNITPAPSAGEIIDAIEIVSHDWKSAPDEHVSYGVIAQDLALVAPQAVLQGDDGDEIEKTWGVDYSKLVPILIKEIQTLRARVAALESA